MVELKLKQTGELRSRFVGSIDINKMFWRNFLMARTLKIHRALSNSKASVELEGLNVSSENDRICEQLLTGMISNDEANRLILKSHGINL